MSRSNGVPPRVNTLARDALSKDLPNGFTVYNITSSRLEYWIKPDWLPVGGVGTGAAVATDAEVLVGTAEDRVATVRQMKQFFALKHGEVLADFTVEDADRLTKEALNASQFNETDIVSEVDARTELFYVPPSS